MCPVQVLRRRLTLASVLALACIFGFDGSQAASVFAQNQTDQYETSDKDNAPASTDKVFPPSETPDWDYEDWAWVQPEECAHMYALPSGSIDLLTTSREAIESPANKPLQLDSVSNFQTPNQEEVLFLLKKEISEDITDDKVRKLFLQTFPMFFNLDDIIETKTFKRELGFVVQIKATSKLTPLGDFDIEGKERYVLAIRFVQLEKRQYVHFVTAPTDKFDDERAEKILDSVRIAPADTTKSNKKKRRKNN